MKSKSKKVKKLVVPTYTSDKKLTMLPIDLAGGNILPDEFKKYLPLVKQMIAASPIKEGIAYLTIDEKLINAGETQRRGGPHIDGNFLPLEQMGTGGWGARSRLDWKVGGDGRTLTSAQHKQSYTKRTGGMLIVSNFSLCKGWNGDFKGTVGEGGNCVTMTNQLKKNKGFMLKPNVLYVANSQFIHESLPTKETIKRVMVRITLPDNKIVV